MKPVEMRVFLVGLVAFAAGCGQDAVDAALTQQSEGPQLARWLAEGQGGDATGAPDAADAADVTTAPDAVDATVAPDGADGGDTTVLGDATETTATDAVATDAALEVDVAPPPCQGPSDCPDAPPCQKATCVDQVCGTAADPLAFACDDGDPCTLVDSCQSGSCVGHGSQSCLDLDPCTDDTCTPGVGCEHHDVVCDDGDACTDDSCVAGFGCISEDVVCPPTQDPCREAVCVSEIGCTAQPASGHPTCDDGDACTTGDRCGGGDCAGTPKACDDGNPCTADVCIDGGCTATAIPGCVVDAQCANKDAGVACNDQDSATSGDLCLAGACHGFTTAHVAASVVSGAAGMVVKEIDHNAAGWSAVLWTIDGDSAETYVLADLTTLASPFVYVETEQTTAAYSGLRDGFAADSDGYVWELEGDAWSYDNTWTNTLFDSGLGEATDLWTMRDTNQQGALGARRMWIVGNDGSDEWVRYCFEDDQGAVKCEVQDFDDFQSSSLPTAVWGVPSCDGPRCQGAMLATAADAATGGGAYLDTYENDDGTAGTWSKGSVPGAPATRTSRAIVGWGSAASAQFLAVGTNGHMVHRRANGSWSSALNVKDGQSTRNFSGVWEGSGVVAVSATHIGTGGMLEYELWTCPSGKDVETGSNWTIHLLGQFVSVSVAGLYDVAGSATGEMRVVGANKKPGDAASQLLEGLVFVRTP